MSIEIACPFALLDNERQMWAYRDWVVKAFNRNLPFDQFTVEQLAGDLLPSPTTDQLVATGFNRCNVTTGEGGSIDAEWIFRYAVDRTATTFQAWMGLTAGCAVCNDHKYDPLSQKEFYSLYAFFHSAADPALDGNALRTAPLVQLKNEADQQQLRTLEAEMALAEKQVTHALATVAYVDPSTLNPPPAPRDEVTVWLDDNAPSGFRGTTSTHFVDDGSPVLAGQKSLRHRSEDGVQDIFESEGTPIVVPANARFFAHVYLEPANPPKEIQNACPFLSKRRIFPSGCTHSAAHESFPNKPPTGISFSTGRTATRSPDYFLDSRSHLNSELPTNPWLMANSSALSPDRFHLST